MGKRKSRDDDSIYSQIGNTVCSEYRKRLRSYKSFRSCTSPQSSLLNRRPDFNWFEEDIWTEIAKHLDGKCIVMLGSSCRWFRRLILEEDSVWRYACLRDLQVPPFRQQVSFKWIKLYVSAFDGSHSYLFRQQDKHIDWTRIGAFFFDSSAGLLTEKLPLLPRLPKGESVEKMLQTTGSCILNNVKTGIWIADLQLVRCPVCNLDTCEGTMQTLDARHIELFLTEGYKSGSWDYKEIGSYQIREHTDEATGAIFDVKHLRDRATTEVLDLKKWAAKPSDWQPTARIACHGVAVNTNLEENDAGLQVRYHAMRAGKEDDSEVVSIRISQQLL
ncbi:hypothetical protein MKW94_007602 [Papaver nudicaule]|uniref:Uncharacterized protein n=1 Tax=Papaver nudicaule TaxID=74823 RepID=A0AA42B5A9_PAPNU|nr:hypothetical protein [Papaver nudicaule]